MKFNYNLIAIGAGSGRLVSAYIAAAVKAKVALIEKDKMGGVVEASFRQSVAGQQRFYNEFRNQTCC